MMNRRERRVHWGINKKKIGLSWRDFNRQMAHEEPYRKGAKNAE